MLCGTCAGKKISIHAAREGGDRSQQQDRIALPISIHAAREGGDTSPNQGFHNLQRFQSTPPVKAATQLEINGKKLRIFQSTPPVKAATTDGSDEYARIMISIHAAREGGDCSKQWALKTTKSFQSTPPVKAATDSGKVLTSVMVISIHAAREGGDAEILIKIKHVHISIHAAREGGDPRNNYFWFDAQDFNPRRP